MPCTIVIRCLCRSTREGGLLNSSLSYNPSVVGVRMYIRMPAGLCHMFTGETWLGRSSRPRECIPYVPVLGTDIKPKLCEGMPSPTPAANLVLSRPRHLRRTHTATTPRADRADHGGVLRKPGADAGPWVPVQWVPVHLGVNCVPNTLQPRRHRSTHFF